MFTSKIKVEHTRKIAIDYHGKHSLQEFTTKLQKAKDGDVFFMYERYMLVFDENNEYDEKKDICVNLACIGKIKKTAVYYYLVCDSLERSKHIRTDFPTLSVETLKKEVNYADYAFEDKYRKIPSCRIIYVSNESDAWKFIIQLVKAEKPTLVYPFAPTKIDDFAWQPNLDSPPISPVKYKSLGSIRRIEKKT